MQDNTIRKIQKFSLKIINNEIETLKKGLPPNDSLRVLFLERKINQLHLDLSEVFDKVDKANKLTGYNIINEIILYEKELEEQKEIENKYYKIQTLEAKKWTLVDLLSD